MSGKTQICFVQYCVQWVSLPRSGCEHSRRLFVCTLASSSPQTWTNPCHDALARRKPLAARRLKILLSSLTALQQEARTFSSLFFFFSFFLYQPSQAALTSCCLSPLGNRLISSPSVQGHSAPFVNWVVPSWIGFTFSWHKHLNNIKTNACCHPVSFHSSFLRKITLPASKTKVLLQ